MEKVLLTGAAGFIGSSVTRLLVGLDRYEIIAPVISKNDVGRLSKIRNQLKLIECDLVDFKQVDGLILKYKPNFIFHLATKGVYTKEWNDRTGILMGNYAMSVNLLEAVYKHNSKKKFLKHFINTGSVFEYGTKKGRVNEDDVVLDDNLNEYSASKKATTTLTLTYKDYFPVSVIRPFTAYGPYGDKGRFIEASILRALKGEEIRIVKGVVRDFVYVDDVADLFIKAMGNKKVYGEIVNVGSGKGVTLEETASEIVKTTKSNSKIVIDDSYKRNKDSRCWAGISKANKLVGWKPKTSISNGVKLIQNYLKKVDNGV